MVSPLLPAPPPPPAHLSLEVSGGQGGSGVSPPIRAGSPPSGRDSVTRLAAMIDTLGLARPLWLDIQRFAVGPLHGHQLRLRCSFWGTVMLTPPPVLNCLFVSRNIIILSSPTKVIQRGEEIHRKATEKQYVLYCVRMK